MYIAEIEIADLRSFRGTQRVSLARSDGRYAGWTVFAGRNGAGKSTLLKAVALAVVGPDAARALVGTFPAWVRQGAVQARVATRLVPIGSYDLLWRSDEPVGLDANPLAPVRSGVSAPAPPSLSVSLQWQKVEGRGDLLVPDVSHDLQAAVEGPWDERPLGWFVVGYGPYRHLGPPPAALSHLSADTKLARLVNLFHESATLSEAIDWLKTVHARALEGREGMAALRDAVLDLLRDGLLPDGSEVERVDSEGLWVCRDGVSLPLEQVSDGYRTVAALVVDLARRLHDTYRDLRLSREGGTLHCPLPGVVLIDEVDAHMHVAWQQRIGFWLTAHFPALQFLVTTHSPFICQAASDRGIIRLPGPGEARTMEHIRADHFRAVVGGGADDAVMSELFGLDHAHSAAAERLRGELAALELKLLQDSADEADKARYAQLQAQVPDDMASLAEHKVRVLHLRESAE
jgi:energy-coupling factor transporter ATP-binding protein EcfA2